MLLKVDATHGFVPIGGDRVAKRGPRVAMMGEWDKAVPREPQPVMPGLYQGIIGQRLDAGLGAEFTRRPGRPALVRTSHDAAARHLGAGSTVMGTRWTLTCLRRPPVIHERSST
jgi:hypothetical protein